MKHSIHFFIGLIVLALFSACGSGGGGGSGNGTGTGGVPLVAQLSLLAGNTSGIGDANGMGAAASFYYPRGVARDSAGNVYVADSGNNTIRKITPAGEVTNLAGAATLTGSTDGTGAAARFNSPRGAATDSAGNVYVADYANSTVRKITPTGVVTTLAGTAGVTGSTNGPGAAASFNSPSGVATDSAGNVYVADTNNHSIRMITPAGVVTTLAGTGVVGSTDGPGAAASFNYPSGVATDSAGNVYVADTNNSTIRMITPAGVVTTLAGTATLTGGTDATGAAARFNFPTGAATDSAGNVYVADYSNSTIRMITPAGVVTTLAGTATTTGMTNATGAAATFYLPEGVASDSTGNIYVADSGNNAIRKITPAGVVTTLAGTPGVVGNTDADGAAARFFLPEGVATDSAGNVYVADTNNDTIRKITATGVVTTLAGSPGVVGSADGTGAAASFNGPNGVATDSAGNVYVADSGNNTIRKINLAGVTTTLAGTAGVGASIDGTGAAARFNFPRGVATDSAGNVYVADTNNGTIRKITPAGVVTTLAGTAGVVGGTDATGVAAAFYLPSGVASDSAGNVYVADTGNSTIRKITPAGVVTTLAGTAGVVGSADATGAAATLNLPSGVAFDSAGNLYVADTGNGTIRKITPAGVVTSVMGHAGVLSFAPGNLPGGLVSPYGVALHGRTLYTTTNNAIVQVTNVP